MPIKWTVYLAIARRLAAVGCSSTLAAMVDATVVFLMGPDSRPTPFTSSVLTPVLRHRHPDCGNTC